MFGLTSRNWISIRKWSYLKAKSAKSRVFFVSKPTLKPAASNWIVFLERLKTYVKDPYGCDLLDKLLTMDPSKRVDADAALNHDFFWTDPMPCDLSKMLGQHGQSMFEFLAPPRRAGRPAHPAMQAQPKPNPSADSSYQDRVFWSSVRLFPFSSLSFPLGEEKDNKHKIQNFSGMLDHGFVFFCWYCQSCPHSLLLFNWYDPTCELQCWTCCYKSKVVLWHLRVDGGTVIASERGVQRAGRDPMLCVKVDVR